MPESKEKLSTFLGLLPIELSELKDEQYIEPRSKLEEGCKILGDFSDSMKRLYTLWLMKERRAKEYAMEAEYNTSLSERKRFAVLAIECKDKSEAVRQLFWIALQDELSLWNAEHIGVIEGWKVATSLPPQNVRGMILGGGPL